jgi:sec-independent protein translocase protein TatA
VFQNIGSTELLLIGFVLLFLFGGRKLPELARGVGQSIKEIRNAAKE